MKKILGTIFFVLYGIMAIFVTVLLLSYNQYHCSELGPYTFYIVKDDTMEPDYKLGDLIIIKSASDKNISVGDNLYFYDVISKNEYIVNYKKLLFKTQSSRHITYTVEDGSTYDSAYLIGKEDGSITVHGLGAILSVLESRWGYLFFVVIMSLLLFLQELLNLIMEIRHPEEAEEDDDDDDDDEEPKPKAKTKTKTKTKSKKTETKIKIEKKSEAKKDPKEE